MMTALRRVSMAVALGLSANSYGGDFTAHATTLTQLYRAQVDSLNSGLQRDETAITNQLFAGLNYDSKLLSLDWDSTLIDARYSEDTALNRLEAEYRLSNQLSLLNDRLTLRYIHAREKNQINVVRSGFKDQLFERDDGYSISRNNVELRYDSPLHYPLDVNMLANIRKGTLSEPSVSGDRGLGGREYRLDFGDYKHAKGMHWKTSLERLERRRSAGADFVLDEARFNFRAPLYERLHLAGTGRYADRHNADSQVVLQDQIVDTQKVAGLGLAWVKSSEHFVQLTRDWDFANEMWSVSGMVQWQLADRWSLNAEHQRRFYGDQTALEFTYKGERSQLRVYHNEWFELRYFARPERRIEGIYLCESNDEGEVDFDESGCFMPDSLNIVLAPGQSLLTRYETLYPIEESLSLRKHYGLSWDYTRAKHQWHLRLRRTHLTDVDSGEIRRGAEGEFEGSYRLDATSSIAYAARYRMWDYTASGNQSRDRQYEVGYYHALNRKAEWFVKLVRTSKGSEGWETNFDDNRIVFGYRHHFGQHNPNKRGKFEAYQPSTTTYQR
jgi:uncharacterized protein (PEP-CTERM system associated)